MASNASVDELNHHIEVSSCGVTLLRFHQPSSCVPRSRLDTSLRSRFEEQTPVAKLQSGHAPIQRPTHWLRASSLTCAWSLTGRLNRARLSRDTRSKNGGIGDLDALPQRADDLFTP